MAERPFNVLGIQQIAIGGLDKSALSGLWSGLFGVTKVGDYVSESENVDEDILQLGTGPHAVEIDLMQPLNPDVSPKVHVPTLNHVGLWIDDLRIEMIFPDSGTVFRFNTFLCNARSNYFR